MFMRLHEAIRDALNEIQELGYVVLPSDHSRSIDLLWLGSGDPPNVENLIEIIRVDPRVLKETLEERMLSIPFWLFMGYPWDFPLDHWKTIKRKYARSARPLECKKSAYASASIEFHKDKRDVAWKNMVWREPWPIDS